MRCEACGGPSFLSGSFLKFNAGACFFEKMALRAVPTLSGPGTSPHVAPHRGAKGGGVQLLGRVIFQDSAATLRCGGDFQLSCAHMTCFCGRFAATRASPSGRKAATWHLCFLIPLLQRVLMQKLVSDLPSHQVIRYVILFVLIYLQHL